MQKCCTDVRHFTRRRIKHTRVSLPLILSSVTDEFPWLLQCTYGNIHQMNGEHNVIRPPKRLCQVTLSFNMLKTGIDANVSSGCLTNHGSGRLTKGRRGKPKNRCERWVEKWAHRAAFQQPVKNVVMELCISCKSLLVDGNKSEVQERHGEVCLES